MGCNASIKEPVGQMSVGKDFPLGERARGRVQGTAAPHTGTSGGRQGVGRNTWDFFLTGRANLTH